MKKTVLFCFFILCAILSYAQEEDQVFDLPPGTYAQPITLNPQTSSSQTQLFYNFHGNDENHFIPLTRPIRLYAAQGQTRAYTVQIRTAGTRSTESFSYVIDRTPPETPELANSLETIISNQSLCFQEAEDTSIYYRFSNGPETWQEYQSSPIVIRENSFGSTLFAYAEDSAGNTSATASWQIPRNVLTEEAHLSVLSPVEGDFYNTQLLAIHSSGFEWIKYTTDGSDPVENGNVYVHPIMIDRTGEITLRISAKPLTSNEIARRRIVFSAQSSNTDIDLAESGLYDEQVSISEDSIPEGWLFTFREKMPDMRPSLPSGTSELSPIENSLVTYPLRLYNSEEEREYRYFYVFDQSFFFYHLFF
ncbi:MAG: FN3 associated domain-containing protein [Spirochaetia bacterium]